MARTERERTVLTDAERERPEASRAIRALPFRVRQDGPPSCALSHVRLSIRCRSSAVTGSETRSGGKWKHKIVLDQ